MNLQPQFWPALTFVFVVLSWAVFTVAFIIRKPPRVPDVKKDPASRPGIFLQFLSYGLVWTLWRPVFTPIAPIPPWAQMVLALATMAIAAASVWITLAAVRTLGKQWSYEARLVEGHKLVVGGPYRFVRHPIYTGMLGKVVATGLAVSHWWALAAAVLLYCLGTAIRVRSEEKLLRGAFGEDFEAYTRYVPAIIPRLSARGE